MPEEMLEVVDENNKVLRLADRTEISKDGLLHRCVYVVLFNSRGEVLMQKRGPTKRAYPNCWDLRANEHPHPGESYEQASYRGLGEELGITEGVQLVKAREACIYPNDNGTWRHPEFAEVWKGIYEGEIKVDGIEVSEARFCSPEEVEKILKVEKVMAGFSEIWNWVKENLPELKK